MNPALDIDYDVRNPPAESLLATYTYGGPKLSLCSEPVFLLADAFGNNLDFLGTDFNQETLAITVFLLPNATEAEKTSYNVSAVFSLPGVYEFSLGLVLNVEDICDDSYWEAAPTLEPNEITYYIG